MSWSTVTARIPTLLLVVTAVLGLATMVTATPAYTLTDEIRVYNDDIVDRGEFELESHVSTVPRKRGVAASTEDGTLRGMILTPELSYGLGEGWEVEAGLFVPVLRSDDGARWQVSPHARAKWIPIRPPAGGGGFAGLILEWGLSPRTPSQSKSEVDLRPVLGWRDGQWLVATNLIVTLTTDGDGSRRPSLGSAGKIVRRLDEQFGVGIEYHGDWGRWRRHELEVPRTQVMYLTLDLERPWNLHLGIGRGLDAASGGWAIKGSLQLPFD
jgi:hypothetical protein